MLNSWVHVTQLTLDLMRALYMGALFMKSLLMMIPWQGSKLLYVVQVANMKPLNACDTVV